MSILLIDLAPWGFSPGSGHFYCSDCQVRPDTDGVHTGHRHSTRCIEHALEARLRAIRAQGDGLVEQGTSELDRHIQTAVDELDEDFWLGLACILLALILIGAVWVAFGTPI